MTLVMAFVLVLLFSCSDDATSVDSGAPRFDGGRDGGRPDAGAADAGFDASTDAGVDAAAPDAGPCDSVLDCPLGQHCWRGACTAASEIECCSTGECPGIAFCAKSSCRCVDPTGCCTDETLCEDGVEYCLEDCTCAPIPTCDPPCPPEELCNFGTCEHRCYTEGCGPDDICTPTGCRPPFCTRLECISRDPPLRCDPMAGCYDTCTPDVLISCGMLDASCRLGFCVDPRCSPTGIDCGYRVDCCGNYHCLRAGDPDPPCPPVCTPTQTPPSEDLCICSTAGFCLDLNTA
jgi:hypothetical protein